MKVKHLKAILAHADEDAEVQLIDPNTTKQLTFVVYETEGVFHERHFPEGVSRFRNGQPIPARLLLGGSTPWFCPYDDDIGLNGPLKSEPDLLNELEALRDFGI